MKENVRKIITYEAIDGTTFNDEKECRAYENGLPAHLRFCLEKKYTAEQLRKLAYWKIGYQTTTATTEYEAPGFLREGGDYTSYHYNDTLLELVHGELSDVISYALETDWAHKSDKFISEVKVVDLTERQS